MHGLAKIIDTALEPTGPLGAGENLTFVANTAGTYSDGKVTGGEGSTVTVAAIIGDPTAREIANGLAQEDDLVAQVSAQKITDAGLNPDLKWAVTYGGVNYTVTRSWSRRIGGQVVTWLFRLVKA